MHRKSVFIALLALINVSRCQEGSVQYAEAEETAVLVVVSGIDEFEGIAFESPLFDIAVSNDNSFNPVQILGRRFGPFDGPVQDDFNFVNQIWSLLISRLGALDDVQSQIATAMALRCPRMRQHALQNILFKQYYNSIAQEGSDEPGFIGAAAIPEEDADTFSSSSSNGKWLPGIVVSYAEEPDSWNKIEENTININDDVTHRNKEEVVSFIDPEMDDDDDDPSRDVPTKMPLSSLPIHHHHHQDTYNDFSHAHAHTEPDLEDRIRPGGGGFKTKPIFFNPFDHNDDGNNHHSRQPLPLLDEVIFSATVFTDVHENLMIQDTDFINFNSAYSGVREREEGEAGEEQFVNWQLWNEDGSVNTGLLLFIALCVACAAVWTALLTQCASMGYAWATGKGGSARGQFMVLATAAASDSESDNEEENDGELKAWKKKQNASGVVLAADYTEC